MEQIPSAKYDVVICGAGPAGLNAACRIATGVPGSHVILLDRKLPGTTIVSIGHRSTLEAFHQRDAVLSRTGNGFTLQDRAKTAAPEVGLAGR